MLPFPVDWRQLQCRPKPPDLSYLTRCPLSVLRSNFGRLGLPEHLTTFIIVCCGISPNSQHMASNLSRAEASLSDPSILFFATRKLSNAACLPILLISSFCLTARCRASLISLGTLYCAFITFCFFVILDIVVAVRHWNGPR